MEDDKQCKCIIPSLDYCDFEQDPAGDQFGEDQWGGEITVQRCKHCGTRWIRYLIKYPAFTSSGRWCSAPITDDDLRTLTPDEVLPYLSKQPMYLYGGSFFESSGKVGKQPFTPEVWVRTR